MPVYIPDIIRHPDSLILIRKYFDRQILGVGFQLHEIQHCSRYILQFILNEKFVVTLWRNHCWFQRALDDNPENTE